MEIHPKLFRIDAPLRQADVVSPSFPTPLGRIDLFLEANGIELKPSSVFCADETTIFIWPEDVGAELILFRPILSLPKGMSVTDAYAAILRLTPTNHLIEGSLPTRRSKVFRCRWDEKSKWTEVGPEIGENLDAQSWTDGKTKVTVGLPDYETDTTYRRDGFEVAIKQKSQLHFVCAWSPDITDDISTWFAVDYNPK
ncbi:hypothetical protein KIH39_20535 [Telmatocola sphagniphila]|uniref:Uncharacterized protein n=1 Tax=Telmatocola sphagniphila TaxID=1123043 RepID=A0A8E6B3J5_9BACT|nr:hypothetical protein [Telmatocola sphagniphila]QVL31212.1 hypothetical protein KIH39_20535 [Telmatocola sphagniphila]